MRIYSQKNVLHKDYKLVPIRSLCSIKKLIGVCLDCVLV